MLRPLWDGRKKCNMYNVIHYRWLPIDIFNNFYAKSHSRQSFCMPTLQLHSMASSNFSLQYLVAPQQNRYYQCSILYYTIYQIAYRHLCSCWQVLNYSLISWFLVLDKMNMCLIDYFSQIYCNQSMNKNVVRINLDCKIAFVRLLCETAITLQCPL
jgi:hypothetical protein